MTDSTILDTGAAVHLVNDMDKLDKGSFQPISGIRHVESGTTSFQILSTGTRTLKGILNTKSGKRSGNLIL